MGVKVADKIASIKARQSPASKVAAKLSESKRLLDQEIVDKAKEALRGLKGDKGDKGDIGPMGPRGFKGEDGHTPVAGIDFIIRHGKDGKDGSNVDVSGYVPYIGATGDVTLGIFGVQANVIDCPEIYSSAGSLKIMPDAQGNVDLFSDTDVANNVDGKQFSINRRAAEGDTTLGFFINDDQWAHIWANWDVSIYSTVTSGVIKLGAVSTNVVHLVGTINSIGEPSGNKNLPLRHYGYITADSAQRYVTWLLDDDDDYFHLTRSDTNILGFKIEMPVNLNGGLNATGGQIRGIVTVDDTYIVLLTDYTVICNKATNFVVTLPTAVVGQMFMIKNINIGVVTVDGDGGDTIDGDPNVTLNQWDSVTIQCYAANKWVIV